MTRFIVQSTTHPKALPQGSIIDVKVKVNCFGVNKEMLVRAKYVGMSKFEIESHLSLYMSKQVFNIDYVTKSQ